MDRGAGTVTRGLVLVAALLAMPRPAHADPSDRDLVLTGLALALPTYALGVVEHEGSHALAAELVGAHVDEFHVLPGRDPHIGVFRFGWTYVHGLRTRADKVWFYIAPKLTDAALLGTFAALVFTRAWPHDRYGQLGLTVLATGSWVDFSKDVVLFSPHNDVVKVFDLWCFRGWRQIPARAVYAAAVVGFGLVVAKGYERTFASDPHAAALVMPLVTTAF